MSVRRLSAAAVAVAAAVTGSVMVVTPAYAVATQTTHCTGGGFDGWIRLTTSSISGPGTVYRVEYRIDKNGQSGGNNANVYWNDYGTQPTLRASTATGIQDNDWHTLRETNYSRGSGGNNYKFIFDKSSAGDPECGREGPL
jgi:hypothetical protein